MVTVGNSTSLSLKAATGNRVNGASGLRPTSSDVSSYEPLTYAHLSASSFSHESLGDKGQGIQGRSGNYADAINRAGFKELMEVNALAMAAAGAASGSVEATGQAVARDRFQGQAPARKEPTFSISMVGNQIQLAFNPKASQG
jgi:hypothetical protein